MIPWYAVGGLVGLAFLGGEALGYRFGWRQGWHDGLDFTQAQFGGVCHYFEAVAKYGRRGS